MQSSYLRLPAALTFLACLAAWGQSTPSRAASQHGDGSASKDSGKSVPRDTIIMKGAWSSASDVTTPAPEAGGVTNNVLTNRYFGISYALPQDWIQRHTPPPPTDSGLYVLTQFVPGPSYKEKTRGIVMITAQDMFFTPLPANNARQLVNYSRNHLQKDYQLELKPTETRIAGRPFIFYAYWSPVAGIHWYILATQIRCHAVQIVMSSRDTKMLEGLTLDLNRMKLPAEANPTRGAGGGDVPVCIKDYAKAENLIERVDPVSTVRRFNPIPVRIIIDKTGRVKYIHFLSAFPEQEKAISDALKQWKFRSYEVDGKRVEVETGIMFGSAPPRIQATAADLATD